MKVEKKSKILIPCCERSIHRLRSNNRINYSHGCFPFSRIAKSKQVSLHDIQLPPNCTINPRVTHTHTHATKDKHCTHMHFKSSYPFPFECIAYPKIPGPTSLSLFPLALNTMAPAPSPNRIHEFRSSQSTHRVRASAPMTSACLAAPLLLLL